MSPEKKHRSSVTPPGSPANPVREVLGVKVTTNGNMRLDVGQRLLDAFHALIGHTQPDETALHELKKAIPDRNTAGFARRRLMVYVQHVGDDSAFVHRVHKLLQDVEPLLPNTPAKPVGRITKHHTVGIKPVVQTEASKVAVQPPEKPIRSHNRTPNTSVLSKDSFLPSGTSFRGVLRLPSQTKDRSRNNNDD